MAVDADFSKVALLLHCEGSNGSTTVTDSSSATRSLTAVGNAQISTAQSKYGSASLLLDGNGDYLTGAASEDFAFGTGDFTVEFFARKSGNGVNGYDVPICTYSGTTGSTGWWIELSTTRGFLFAGGSGTPSITYATNPNDGAWHHWAVCRAGTTLRLFRDGLIVASKSDSTAYTQSTLMIGRDGVNDFFNGHLDEFRVTKGVARYTADFTPPTAAFPDSSDGGDVNLSGSTTVTVVSSATGKNSIAGIGSATVSVSSEGAGAVEIRGQASALCEVTSSATGVISNPGAEFSGSTVVSVTSAATASLPVQLTGQAAIAVTSSAVLYTPTSSFAAASVIDVQSGATGAVAVRATGSATVEVTSTADAVVRSAALFTGAAAVEVTSSATASLSIAASAATQITVASAGGPVTALTGAATIDVTSAGQSAVQVALSGASVIEVTSLAIAQAAISAAAQSSISVTSDASGRVGVRDFARDVSVVTRQLRAHASNPSPQAFARHTSPRSPYRAVNFR